MSADRDIIFRVFSYSYAHADRKQMIILIPFYLLKLRKSIETARTPENSEALKKLLSDDIIGSISRNLEAMKNWRRSPK